MLNGLTFGVLALALMVARIRVDADAFIDARYIPIALITLFEGWPVGIVACLPAVAYRLWLGGPGMWPGVAGLVAAVLLASAAHAWARREGGVRARHAFALAGAIFAMTAATYAVTGAHARTLLNQYWPEMLAACAVGIGVFARLFHDVSERARIALERQRFHDILDQASDAIRIVDLESHRIVDCNRRDAELSGHAVRELIGRDGREFWPPDGAQHPRPRPAPSRDAEPDGARTFGEPYRRASGEVVAVDCTRHTVEHGDGRYEILIYRESAEREAREAAQRETAQLKAVTLLAGAAAHEINNPLAIVMGSLDLLSHNLSPSAQQTRWIDQALGAVRRIRDIVTRMNHITRVEATPIHGGLPSILDIEKSTAIPRQEAS